MLGPAGFRGLGCHFSALFLGHGLEPTLPADLTTFAPDGGHVRGQVYGDYSLGRNDELIGLVFRGAIYDPLGELVRIARTFSFADGHVFETFLPREGERGKLAQSW
jgi:hypothetical protein